MKGRALALTAVMLWSATLALPPAAAQAAAGPGLAASAPPASLKSLPLKREDAAAAGQSFGLLAPAVGVLVAAAGLLLLLRRGRPAAALQRWKAHRVGAGSGVVRLASQSLSPHASVHVIRWSDEELLLACTMQQVTVLARRPAEKPQKGDA